MSAIKITCTAPEGVYSLAPETVTALDRLARTLGTGPWQIDVLIGHTPADTLHLTARPEPTERTTP